MQDSHTQSTSFADVTVTLAVNSQTPGTIPNTKLRGCYQIMVQGQADGNASATFFISKASSDSNDFSLFRVTNSPANTGETVSLAWASGQNVQLYHTQVRTSGDNTAHVRYEIKFMSNLK